MLKKSAIRRIMVSTIALIIVSILYFFPKEEKLNIKQNVEHVSVNTSPIYLLDSNERLIRTSILTNATDSLEKAKELIESLTKESKKGEYIPKDFKQIIPKNTKVLNISLDNNLLKINFSREFLNVEKEEEEKLIESLIYTLTQDPNITGIMIFIEEKKLETLPKSNIKLPNILDKNFGINKVYDITSLKDITKTTIYYVGKKEDLVYYIPITKVDNNPKDKIEIIINELKSSPIYETNLLSYLASNVELLGYEALENQINLSFNSEILSDFNERNILEEVKYTISLSIQDTLNIEKVNFIVDNEKIET